MSSKRIRQQSDRSSEGSDPEAAVDMQRKNNGRAPEGGRFTKGNTCGFRKGRSGNPAGRPKSAMLSDVMRRELASPCPDDEQGRTWAEVIADQLIAKAAAGDVAAAKEIADRTEGKARQHVNLSYTEREKYEIAVAKIMEESGCSREEAIRTLGLFRPDVLALLNVN
jgi:hypothetical protein